MGADADASQRRAAGLFARAGAGEPGTAEVMAGAQILEQRACAGEHENGEQAYSADMDEQSGTGRHCAGEEERVRAGHAADWGMHVCHD